MYGLFFKTYFPDVQSFQAVLSEMEKEGRKNCCMLTYIIFRGLNICSSLKKSLCFGFLMEFFKKSRRDLIWF